MGIRAGLKKNTEEIRNKIKELGIECTTSNWGDLVYIESAQCVTWGDANGFGIYNCGDNEDFFFYLMTLHTLNDREIENLKEEKNRYYQSSERFRKDYDQLQVKYLNLHYKYDNLDTTIRDTLFKLHSDVDLEKENIQLKKEIEELKQKLQKNEKKNS